MVPAQVAGSLAILQAFLLRLASGGIGASCRRDQGSLAVPAFP